MRHQLAVHLAALALALLALAKWLDGPRPGGGRGKRSVPGGTRLLELPRSEYRWLNLEPSRWEVVKLGLSILFNSLAWGMGVSYG